MTMVVLVVRGINNKKKSLQNTPKYNSVVKLTKFDLRPTQSRIPLGE